MRDFANAAFGGKVDRVETINAAHARVGGDQLIGELRQRFQIAFFFGASGSFFSSEGFFSSLGAISNALISTGGSNIESGTLSYSTESTTIVCEMPAPAIFCVTRE